MLLSARSSRGSVGEDSDGYGVVGVPIASAPSEIKSGLGLCGEHCSTTNVGLCAPSAPPLYLVLREGGATTTKGRRPPSGRGLRSIFQFWRQGYDPSI
jgi:hypothetical protein